MFCGLRGFSGVSHLSHRLSPYVFLFLVNKRFQVGIAFNYKQPQVQGWWHSTQARKPIAYFLITKRKQKVTTRANFQIWTTQRLLVKRYSTDIPLSQFLGEQYQSSFHCIPVDNQYQTHLMLLVILTALTTPVWLIMTNLKKLISNIHYLHKINCRADPKCAIVDQRAQTHYNTLLSCILPKN